MSNVSPLLGRKFSPGRLKRHREAVARRKAEGFYAYRTHDRRTKKLVVECSYPRCGNQFEFVFSPRYSLDRRCYCSHDCQVRHNHMLRTRVPDAKTLREMYVDSDMSAIEIAKLFNVSGGAIREALMRAGIPRRKPGARPKKAMAC